MEQGYKKILCPIDFQPNSAMALKRAASMVRAYGGELTVAHIVNNPFSETYGSRILNAWGDRESIEKACLGKPLSCYSDIILEVAQVMLDEFAVENLKGIPYKAYIDLDEHTYRAINDYAEKNEIDLIVMATHGRTGPKRLYFGSVAENVVRRSPCSVLIVRS